MLASSEAIANLQTIKARLDRIDPRLITQLEIQSSLQRGASRVSDAPLEFLNTALDLTRQNPVLAAAFGVGALESEPNAPLSLTALSIALAWWGYYDEAHLLLTVTLPQLDPMCAQYARWHQLLCERRLFGSADTLPQLLEIANTLESSGQSTAAMRCRLDAVSALYMPSLDQQAERLLTQIDTYMEAHGNKSEQAVALLLWAYSYSRQSRFEDARHAIDRSEVLCQQNAMPVMLAFCWMVRGTYFIYRQEMESAHHWLDQAIHQTAALQHEYYQAHALLTKVTACFEQGDIQRGVLAHEAMRQLPSANRLQYVMAEGELTLANLALRQGRYAAANEGYHRAAELYEVVGYPILVAVCRMNLGIVAQRLGQFGLSIRLNNEARQVFAAAGSQNYLALALHNLAKTYAAFGYMEPAIEAAQEGLNILESAGIAAQRVRPSLYLARLLGDNNQADRAHALLNAVSALIVENDLKMERAVAEQVRGGVLLHEERYAESLAAYQRSLALLPLDQHDAGWDSRLGIAEAHLAMRNEPAARTELNHLAAISLPVGLRWRGAHAVGRAALLRRQPQQALDSYINALRVVRDARRSLDHEDEVEQFVLSLRSLYEEAFALATRLRQPSAALELAELHGSQLLSVRLGYDVMPSQQSAAGLAHLTDLLTERLGQDWTVLRYASHSTQGLWLFALTPDGLTSHHLRMSSTFASSVRLCTSVDPSFRELIYLERSEAHPNPRAVSRQSRRALYKALLPTAVRERLNPDHTLIIIPTDQLHRLAFHTLLDGTVPLIEKTRVLYAPSLDLLRASLEAPTPTPLDKMLICAQSHFSDQSYHHLPFAEQEARALADLRAAHTDLMINDSHSREKLIDYAQSGQLGRYGRLHFATHAHYDLGTGAFTGLVLGDNVLGLEDIHAWRLSARLATLSACQTGMGRWYYGDEIAGLTQAFLSAGAQTVVASLWLAPDERTADLMTSFYRSLDRGSLPSAALAEAQRKAHRAGMEPYYWGPFSAFGQP